MKCKCHPLSAFHWKGTPCVIDWGRAQRAQNSSDATTRLVDQKRETGTDMSMRTAGGTTRNLDPKAFHVFSLAKAKA